MIISSRYRYVFIELPQTGSTAIRKELQEHYEGSSFLRHHSTYYDFLKVANADEKGYFVFSCIRNPLDDAVSRYLKYKTDHKGNFTNPARLQKHKGIVNYFDKRIFQFLRKSDADFPAFFRKFYVLPYNNWASLSHERFSFVIRFEKLQEDFATALRMIGIEPKRPLLVINRTNSKKREFSSYYPPAIQEKAKRVFGPFMKRWGYEFPPEWGNHSVPWWNQMEFEFCDIFRNFYWKHLRFRI